MQAEYAACSTELQHRLHQYQDALGEPTDGEADNVEMLPPSPWWRRALEAFPASWSKPLAAATAVLVLLLWLVPKDQEGSSELPSRGAAASSGNVTTSARASASATAYTFVVNDAPTGCHAAPDATADIVVRNDIGTILVVEMMRQEADGTWHHDIVHQCWIRTSPGPIRLFISHSEAEHYAATLQ
jgi:hypothetical protein